MALTLSDITWASLSETRNNRDIIAVSVSERRTYVTKVSAIWLTPAAHRSADGSCSFRAQCVRHESAMEVDRCSATTRLNPRPAEPAPQSFHCGSVAWADFS